MMGAGGLRLAVSSLTAGRGMEPIRATWECPGERKPACSPAGPSCVGNRQRQHCKPLAFRTRPDVLICRLSQAARGQHTSCEHISLLPELAGVVAQLCAQSRKCCMHRAIGLPCCCSKDWHPGHCFLYSRLAGSHEPSSLHAIRSAS